jgi:putative SOS response-associated peptidase YedK
MAPIHDRMPVVIPPEQVEQWLSSETDEATLKAMMRPVADDFLRCDEVSTRVNDARHDAPDCLAPPEPEKPEPEGKADKKKQLTLL